jgi:hypothetical protein
MKFCDKYECNPEDSNSKYGNIMIGNHIEFKKLSLFEMKYDNLFAILESSQYIDVDSASTTFNFNKERIISVVSLNNIGIQLKIKDEYYSIYHGYCSEHQHHGWYVYDDEDEDFIAINSLEVYN